MTRSVIPFLVFMISVYLLNAQPVSEQEARVAAETFFKERIRPIDDDFAESAGVKECIHIEPFAKSLFFFNMSPVGYIITTSDYRSKPIVGYSFEGSFDKTGIPDNLRMWLESYDLQVRNTHITDNEDMGRKNRDEWIRLMQGQEEVYIGRNIEPLLFTSWDQGKFYNQMCPADPAGPGGHCLTGCVATAMGQILNYFMWPDSGVGSYTYYCPPYDSLSADFENSEYRFDLMEPYLVSTNLELAEILNHLGVSVDMVYGPDGSGMYNHKAAYSMRTFFKYLPTTEYVYRDSTAMDWDSLIVTHLDRNIPLYYAGWSVPNIVGHAFVCDGYQGTGYYHFNWGWSGSYDGYFYTDDLTPGGSNFNLAQELIINGVPDTNSYSYPSGCQGLKAYTSMGGTLDDGSGPLFNYSRDASCEWLLTPYDSVISITLSFHRFSVDPSDTLFIYDGEGTSAPLLAALSGSALPDDITSTGNALYLAFETDQSGEDAGWLATFSTEQPIYCSGNTILTNPSDTISDGSGDFLYHDNTSCLWMIQPPGAGYVTLHFTEFATEDTVDHLSIYDLETQELLADYSGIYTTNLPEPVTSYSGKMFLAFSTNYTIREQGWTAFYTTDLVGVTEENLAEAVKIFPSPARNMINVQFTGTGDPSFITLYDLTGKQLDKTKFTPTDGIMKIDVSNLVPGFYMLVIHEGHGKSHAQKVLIQ